jgi:hypothetical protein
LWFQFHYPHPPVTLLTWWDAHFLQSNLDRSTKNPIELSCTTVSKPPTRTTVKDYYDIIWKYTVVTIAVKGENTLLPCSRICSECSTRVPFMHYNTSIVIVTRWTCVDLCNNVTHHPVLSHHYNLYLSSLVIQWISFFTISNFSFNKKKKKTIHVYLINENTFKYSIIYMDEWVGKFPAVVRHLVFNQNCIIILDALDI